MGIKTVINKVDQTLGKEIVKDPEPKPKLGPIADMPGFAMAAGLIGTLVFVLLALPYFQADLWFDEWLTVLDYATAPSLGEVLTSYREANNHILFSALLWGWLRVFGQGNEAFLRLPCVLLALATLYLFYAHGRRLFGQAAAGLFVTLLMAFSPVYFGFFWQLRGYTLSLFLATLATIGALYIVTGRRWLGTVMFFTGALLLPPTVPTNLLVNGSLLLFVNLVLWRRGRWLAHLFYQPLWLAAGFGGMLVYVPIWGKFERVIQQTHGWESGSQVVGHWLLALAAHAGLFMLACYGLRRQRDVQPLADEPRDEPTRELQRLLPWLAGCCLVPMLIVAMLKPPFPRAFLGYLPPLTFAAMAFYSPRLVRINKYLYLMIFFILANYLVWTRTAEHFCNRDLQHGVVRQNLLQQFYARRRDVSTTMRFLASEVALPPNVVIFVDFHFYVAAGQYWFFQGGDRDAIECLSCPDTEGFRLKREREHYPYLPVIVLAYDPEQAIAAFRQNTGFEIMLDPLPSPTPLTIFRVVGPVGPRPPYPPRPAAPYPETPPM